MLRRQTGGQTIALAPVPNGAVLRRGYGSLDVRRRVASKVLGDFALKFGKECLVVVLTHLAEGTGQFGKLVAAAGCELLFLHTYSPDLNPIEHLWAKLKAALRRLLPESKKPTLTISNMCKYYAS